MLNSPHSRRTLAAAALAALSTAATIHAQPRVIYTDAHAAGTQDGSTWQAAFRDLQDALYAASIDPQRTTNGVEIHIAQGVYTPDHGTHSAALSFTLASAVTLMGGFAGLIGADPDERDPARFVSVLSGDLDHNDGPNFVNYGENTHTILQTRSQNVLDGLEISGGNVASGLASVLNTLPATPASVALIIRNCSIVRNHGITLTLFGTRVISSRINQNRSEDGWIVRGQDLEFDSCEIRGNRTVFGTPSGASSTIFLPKFFGNPGSNIFNRCLIADNISGVKGAIYAYETGVDISLEGCTVANNSAYGSGALTSEGAMFHVRNSIISGNFISSTPSDPTQITVPGSTKLDADTTVLIDNGALGIRFSTTPGTAPAVLSGNPLFISPSGPDHDPATWADNNYRLRPGAPAIDRADSAQVRFSSIDLDGKPLYDDPNTPNLGSGAFPYADLGAFEFDGTGCPADFNHSGAISTADIFDYLNAWFAGNPAADFDGTGGVTVADIFDFINAWLGGC